MRLTSAPHGGISGGMNTSIASPAQDRLIESRVDMGLASGLAADGVADEIWSAVNGRDVVIPIATVFQESQVNVLNVAYTDTAKPAVVVAEHDAIPNPATDVTFGNVALPTYKIVAGLQVSSVELWNDSPAWRGEIGEILGKELSRAVGEYLTTGTGTAQPEGVLTGAADSTVSAAAGIDIFLDLIATVDSAYYPNARFMLNSTALIAILKAAASADNIIWPVGGPGSIVGFPVVINSHMPDDKILFGDFESYFVRYRQSGIIMLDELLILDGHVGHLAWISLGGGQGSQEALKFATIV